MQAAVDSKLSARKLPHTQVTSALPPARHRWATRCWEWPEGVSYVCVHSRLLKPEPCATFTHLRAHYTCT
jgi:hypothetical protein